MREPEVKVIRSNHSSSRERKWMRISMTGLAAAKIRLKKLANSITTYACGD